MVCSSRCAAAPGPGAGTTYRYGYNGKEMDNEWYGDAGNGLSGVGNSYDYGFRIYNPRYARFLSVDPLTDGYSSWSPYAFAMNSPIAGIDLDGLEFVLAAPQTIPINPVLGTSSTTFLSSGSATLLSSNTATIGRPWLLPPNWLSGGGLTNGLNKIGDAIRPLAWKDYPVPPAFMPKDNVDVERPLSKEKKQEKIEQKPQWNPQKNQTLILKPTAEEQEDHSQYVYRQGGQTLANMTPRESDVVGVTDQSMIGLSTYPTPELGALALGAGSSDKKIKFVKLSRNKLMAAGFKLVDGVDANGIPHVSIQPTMTQLPFYGGTGTDLLLFGHLVAQTLDWASKKEVAKTDETQAHPLSNAVNNAVEGKAIVANPHIHPHTH